MKKDIKDYCCEVTQEQVNEDGNYDIKVLSPLTGKFEYLTTEYSFSSAVGLINNLFEITGLGARVISKRTDKIVAEA